MVVIANIIFFVFKVWQVSFSACCSFYPGFSPRLIPLPFLFPPLCGVWRRWPDKISVRG